MLATPNAFVPLPWQVAPWRDKAPVLLLTGSAGGGKSRLAAEKIHGYCLKYPGAVWLLMRKAREWCGTSVVPRYVAAVGKTGSVRHNRAENSFIYANGSRVYIGGMLGERQREAIRSMDLDGAWLEEANAFTRDDLNEVLARIRHTAAPWQQVILTTNPDGPRHWINQDFIAGNDPDCAIYYSQAADNTHNSEHYAANLARLTGVLHERLVLGRWAQAEGVIYAGFSLETHVVTRDRSAFPSVYLALDEGFTNPCALLVVGEDSDGRLHVLTEWYETGKLHAEVGTAAARLARQYGAVAAVCDDAAPALIKAVNAAGVYTTGAGKGRVTEGIAEIQNRLQIQGDGRPRLTIAPECANLIAEFQTYAWRDGGREEPLKQNDHALDALRYIAMYRGAHPAPVSEISNAAPLHKRPPRLGGR